MPFVDCTEANFCFKGPLVGLKFRHLSVKDMASFICTGYQKKLGIKSVVRFNKALPLSSVICVNFRFVQMVWCTSKCIQNRLKYLKIVILCM